MKSKKRLLSLLLTLCMIASLLPTVGVTASAETYSLQWQVQGGKNEVGYTAYLIPTNNKVRQETWNSVDEIKKAMVNYALVVQDGNSYKASGTADMPTGYSQVYVVAVTKDETMYAVGPCADIPTSGTKIVTENELKNIGSGGNYLYKAFPQSAVLESGPVVIKDIDDKGTRRGWQEGDSFTFTIEAITPGAPLPEDTTLTITNETEYHRAAFGKITYYKPGFYYYKITETAVTGGGIAKSNTEYFAEVYVSGWGWHEKLVHTAAATEPVEAEAVVVSELTADSTVEEMLEAEEEGYISEEELLAAAEALNATAPTEEPVEEIEEEAAEEENVELEGKGAKPDPLVAVVSGYGVIVNSAVGPWFSFRDWPFGIPVMNTFTPVVLKDSECFTVEKVIDDVNSTGRKWLNSDAFTFTLAAIDNAPMPAFSQLTITKSDIPTDSGYKDSFGEIVYVKAGTYQYEITENDTNIPGISKEDGLKYLVEVTVDTNSSNQLYIKEVKYSKIIGQEPQTYSGSCALFTNKFNSAILPGEVDTGITVKKSLSGRDWKDTDSFTFTLSATSKDAPMPAEGGETVTITKGTANQKAAFGAITYTAEGEYTYTITETATKIAGIAPNTQSYTVVVKVENNEQNKLVASVKSYKLNNQGDNVGVAEFTNTFTPLKLSGLDKGITVTKVIDGRDWEPGDAFAFTLTALNGAPMPTVGGEKVTITNDTANHKAVFGDIEFTEVGQYTYTISETNESVKANKEGMSVDSNHTVVVNVYADKTTNELKATVAYDGKNASSVTFTNSYSVAVLPSVIDTGITVKKVLNGRAWQEGDEFSFTLTAGTKKGSSDKSPMPEGKENGETITISNNTKDYKAVFGAITYTDEGEYAYTITEDDTSLDGVAKDTKVYDVTVKVVKKEKKLKINSVSYKVRNQASVKADKLATFTNVFTPVTLEESYLDVTKSLVNTVEGSKHQWTNDIKFSFKLEAITANAPLPTGSNSGVKTIEIKSDTADKKNSFGAISFTKAGTYEYKITEVIPQTKGDAYKGIKFDTSVYTVTVVVNKDEKTNALSIGSVTYKKDGNAASSISFENKFTSAKLSGVNTGITVSKSISGRDWKSGDSFKFVLETKSAPMPADGDTITIDYGTANHKAAFGEIIYDKAGEYKYSVKEAKDDVKNIPGMKADSSTYTVTVVVDENENSELYVKSITYKKGSTPASCAEFTNVFTPAKLSDDGDYIYVTKTINDDACDAANKRGWKDTDSFSFTLTALNGAPMPDESTTSTVAITNNTADHKANFGDITYNDVGVYNYTITEVTSSIPGMTSDTTTYNVAVTVGVVSSESNALEVKSVVYTVGGVTKELAAFTNTFTPAKLSGDNAITVKKVIDDSACASDNKRGWQSGDTFTFTLAAIDDAPMPAQNTITIGYEEGKSADAYKEFFGDILYNEVGEYYYKITETATNLEGFVKNTEEHNVTVNVYKDDISTKLCTEVVYDGNESINCATFTNVFKPAELSSTVDEGITVQKLIEGRDWEEGDEFTFTLKAVDGAPMPDKNTVTIGYETEEYKAAFGTIKFNKPGDYYYTITEKDAGIQNMTSDETEHTVHIVVAKDEENQLTAHVEDYDGDVNEFVTFTNVYQEPEVQSPPIKLDQKKKTETKYYYGFTDVFTDDYFYTPVYWAVAKSITKGTDDTHFTPNGIITRAQMVTFLWRAAGCPEPTSTTCKFTDVYATDYYYKAVLWAVENNITKGTTDTTFSPADKVTRGQAVTFLYRFCGEKVEGEIEFTDVKEDAYYYDAVVWAVAKGITTGTSKYSFSPDVFCTRAQVVTFIHRAMK